MAPNGTTIPAILPQTLPDLPQVDKELDSQIRTHSSNTSARDPTPYNRLAMLGDAHLTAAVTHILFSVDPPLQPGEMTEIRSVYVSNVNVANWARAYKFDDLVNVARHVIVSEENKDRFAAGSFEAYLGAIVLSSSQNELKDFIAKLVSPGLKAVRESLSLNGNKPMSDRNALQKLHQKLIAEGKALPAYKPEPIGEGIDAYFEVKCVFSDGRTGGSGKGKSILEGKRMAAEQTLRKRKEFFASLPNTQR